MVYFGVCVGRRGKGAENVFWGRGMGTGDTLLLKVSGILVTRFTEHLQPGIYLSSIRFCMKLTKILI